MRAVSARRSAAFFRKRDITFISIATKALTRHVLFVRHSDLSDGDSCHDEVIDRKSLG